MGNLIKDVVIIGAGPAGLMAAKKMIELGYSVMVVEKKQNFNKLKRACSTQFIMDDDYEGEDIKVSHNKIIFQRNNFEVEYNGKLVEVKNKYYHSPKNHIIHFAREKEAFALKFDKRKLLSDLYETCKRLGVEFAMGTLALKCEDKDKEVTVTTKKDGKVDTISGKKLIIAEGVNAHVSGKLGFNKERMHITTAFTVKYFVEGVKNIEPNSWNLFYGKAYYANAPVIIGPSLYGDQVVEVTITGDANLKPDEIYKQLITSSPLKKMFEDARIIEKHGCGVKAFSALRVPYKGNVIVIGDTAAFVEVEVQGALMCGYHAANAIALELQGENGFEQYTKWWQNAFEFNGEDYLKVAQGYALVPTFTDDELDYLFGLIEGQILEGTYSQYKTPKLIWEAILKNKNQIISEAPQIYDKIKKMDQLTLADTFSV